MDSLQIKRDIINIFTNSGINITPLSLDILLDLNKPLEKVNFIIKETSFIASFKSLLTENILLDISDQEIQNALKRKIIQKELNPAESKQYDIKEMEADIPNNNNIEEFSNIPLTFDNRLKVDSDVQDGINKKELKNSQKIYDIKQTDNKDQLSEKKFKPSGTTKSALAYNPIAKEYQANIQILKDPTGKLYTNGDFNDFYELTLDKFNSLRKLMMKRSEAHSATNINRITRLSKQGEVATIGLVNDIRQTKNGNYILQLEDLTGEINVLIKNDSENQDSFKMAQKTIQDQMIFVEGMFNPGEGSSKGIIFSNNATKIDIPYNFEPNHSEDPLSIAFISDTHIGSKEFLDKLWEKFIKFLNGKAGNREISGRIKYLIINGDLVDGIGVYPNQEGDLNILDIFQQYKKAAELIAEIPDYIKIIYSPGNHEPVRNAIPRPAVPKKYAEELINIGVKCVGNPSLISTHNVKTLIYHGDSIHDLNMLIPGLEINKPVKTMEEMLACRHLAPIYGKRSQLAPLNKDWLVIDKIPDIFHTGHVHINEIGRYQKVTCLNSGCFQSQTEFMKSFGIVPTPGKIPIIELDTYNAGIYDCSLEKCI